MVNFILSIPSPWRFFNYKPPNWYVKSSRQDIWYKSHFLEMSNVCVSVVSMHFNLIKNVRHWRKTLRLTVVLTFDCIIRCPACIAAFRRFHCICWGSLLSVAPKYNIALHFLNTWTGFKCNPEYYAVLGMKHAMNSGALAALSKSSSCKINVLLHLTHRARDEIDAFWQTTLSNFLNEIYVD